MHSSPWKIIGKKNKKNITLIHGWGINYKIWLYIAKKLKKQDFKIYLINIPGYNYNSQDTKNKYLTLKQITKKIFKNFPEKSLCIGWSLGGLIATQAAYKYTHKIKGIITISSIPCFYNKKNWPALPPKTFKHFAKLLIENFNYNITNFLLSQIQNLNPLLKIKITNQLKKIIFNLPNPSKHTIKNGLKIILNTDLRNVLSELKIPILRIYGNLDALIPTKLIPIIDNLSPNSNKIVLPKASHIPFISHENQICDIINKFYKITHS